MRRSQIAPGVHLSYDAAQKFNRCRISIHFAFPARRETATAHALLPLVMERGYADCPDMTQMTKKLARLYGADLTVDARPMGCSHNLCVSITGIKDQFALEGEKLTQEYAALALGTAFHPYFVGSTFDPEAVGIEKQMLKKALEDEVNDKRLYCQRQANREFFGDSPAGVRQEGYLEEVDGLTPEALTEAYDEMLRTANIELIVLGCDEASTTAVKDALLAELSAIDRAPLPRAENIAMPRREPVRKVEHFDTTQAKLCMLFTLGQPMQPEQLAAASVEQTTAAADLAPSLMKSLSVREEGENRVLSYVADPAKMNAYVQDALKPLLGSMDVGMIIREVKGEYVINKDDYYTSMNMYMVMDMSSYGETLRIIMLLEGNFNNPGQPVNLELPSTDGYSDLSTYYGTSRGSSGATGPAAEIW